jgi:hypothetical protein
MERIFKTTRGGALVSALVVLPLLANAQDPKCKGSPEVRECRIIKGGVVNLTADAGIVLWSTSEWPTQKPAWRVLGDHDMPPELYKAFDNNMLALMHGDFEACFHREWDAAYNQESVCIESVMNLRVEVQKFD